MLLSLALIFIWGQSLLPSSPETPENEVILDVGITSIEESQAVFDKTQGVFDAVLGEGTITHDLFRKLAHVFEYFAFTIIFNLIVFSLKMYNVKSIFWSLSVGMFVAVIDESFQILSKRVACINDVLIDFIGVIIATILFFAFIFLVKKLKNKKCVNKGEENNEKG